MGEIINGVTDFVSNNGSFISLFIICISAFIEISPIKINPISSLLGWFGRRLCKDTNDKINGLDNKFNMIDNKVNDLSSDLQNHVIQSQRSAILDFATECRKDTKHTKEEFDYIIKLHDNYELYLKERKIPNGQVTCAFNYIIEIYNKCMREDTFL